MLRLLMVTDCKFITVNNLNAAFEQMPYNFYSKVNNCHVHTLGHLKDIFVSGNLMNLPFGCQSDTLVKKYGPFRAAVPYH